MGKIESSKLLISTIMITVVFYKEIKNFWGEINLVRTELDTNKSSIQEAFDFAVQNGANPLKTIKYISKS